MNYFLNQRGLMFTELFVNLCKYNLFSLVNLLLTLLVADCCLLTVFLSLGKTLVSAMACSSKYVGPSFLGYLGRPSNYCNSLVIFY